MLDSLVFLSKVTPDSGRVLLIRLDGIGDCVLWLDAARELSQYSTLR